MKKQFLRPQVDTNSIDENFTPENFSELNLIVEDLLSSIKQKKQRNEKSIKSRSPKKWKRNRNKKKTSEDLGIRELPFTF